MKDHKINNFFIRAKDNHKINIIELLPKKKDSHNVENLIFFHGGPGSSFNNNHIDFFLQFKNLHVILFDQRGCGKSICDLSKNNMDNLLHDIDDIREYFNFEKINIFGGSFGSLLALNYLCKYPLNCNKLFLYGIFFGSNEEINGFYNDGYAKELCPENYKLFNSITKNTNHANNPIEAYYEIFSKPEKYKNIYDRALYLWSAYEKSLSDICIKNIENIDMDKNFMYSHSVIENHYFYNNCFINQQNFKNDLNAQRHKKDIYIFNGLFDYVTPIKNAYELLNIFEDAELHIIDKAGHTMFNPHFYGYLSKFIKEKFDEN